MMVAPVNNSQPTLQPKSNSDLVVIGDFYQREKTYCLQIDSKTVNYSVKHHAGNDLIRGFGVQSEAGNSGAIRAYFSLDRADETSAPRYESNMFFAIDGELYCLHDYSSTVIWKNGFFHRSIQIRNDLKKDFVYSYWWPCYRQMLARAWGDPFNFISKDFFEEFFKIGKFYYPNSFATK